MTTEYGVLYEGRWSTYVAGGYTLAGAREQLAHAAGADPRPVRIVTRECGEWQPLDDAEATA